MQTTISALLPTPSVAARPPNSGVRLSRQVNEEAAAFAHVLQHAQLRPKASPDQSASPTAPRSGDSPDRFDTEARPANETSSTDQPASPPAALLSAAAARAQSKGVKDPKDAKGAAPDTALPIPDGGVLTSAELDSAKSLMLNGETDGTDVNQTIAPPLDASMLGLVGTPMHLPSAAPPQPGGPMTDIPAAMVANQVAPLIASGVVGGLAIDGPRGQSTPPVADASTSVSATNSTSPAGVANSLPLANAGGVATRVALAAAQAVTTPSADAQPDDSSKPGAVEIKGFAPLAANPTRWMPKFSAAQASQAAGSSATEQLEPITARAEPGVSSELVLQAAADAAPTPVPILTNRPPVHGPSSERAGATSPADGRSGMPAAAEAHIAAPVYSPAFGPALGLQISAMARDGTQEARLHLNPSELGPITVKIALDGLGARIDFLADLSGTRQAIEASLPALAGALRDSGLTLTGGGVSQQPSGRQPHDPAGHGGQSDSARMAALADFGDEPQRMLRSLPLARGLVDLVA